MDNNKEIVKYSKENVEKVLNLIDSLPMNGFQSANKLSIIFQILNNPVVDKFETREDDKG